MRLVAMLICISAVALILGAHSWRELRARGASEPACPGKTCTCAGVRHANSHLYRYACECCEAAGCKPDDEMDLTPKKKGKA